MFFVYFLFIDLAISDCLPVCPEDKNCIQVGDNVFSCLESGYAALHNFNRRALLETCDGCEFQIVLQVQTPTGTLLKKQQLYRGIPIVGSHVIESVDALGKVLHNGGNILANIGDDLPDITPTMDMAVLIAPYECEDIESSLAITYINNKAHLIYDVKCWTDVSNEILIGHMWNIQFDAHDGTILSVFDGIDLAKTTSRRLLHQQNFVDAENTVDVDGDDIFDAIGGNSRAGQYQHRFQMKRNGGDCTYDSDHVFVANNQGSSSQDNETPWTFPCNLLPEQNDAVNGAQSPLNDAYAFGLQFWNLYQEWYGIEPLPEKLGLVVHYGSGNAMWDGRKMYFADGDSQYYPFVALDVVAHEVSHGTTQHNSNLVYRDQSGGINEAFSDMAGATAEFYYFGSTEFEMGNKIRKNGGAMRYMCDPTQDGKSIDNVDDFQSSMDVHHSSGVFNKAFCELAQKQNWDPRKAFHVFLTANRVYWDRNTGFQEGANQAVQASVDLGYGSNDICEAFLVVGIVGLGCDGVMTPAPTDASTPTPETPATSISITSFPPASTQASTGIPNTSFPPASTQASTGIPNTSFPPASTQAPQENCIDRSPSSCAMHARAGRCDMMGRFCPKSCNLCSDQTTASPNDQTDNAPTVVMIVGSVPYNCDISGLTIVGESLTLERARCTRRLN